MTPDVFGAIFDKWYFEVFRMFNEKWREAKCDIMEFNHFIQRVIDQDFIQNKERFMREELENLKVIRNQ